MALLAASEALAVGGVGEAENHLLLPVSTVLPPGDCPSADELGEEGQGGGARDEVLGEPLVAGYSPREVQLLLAAGLLVLLLGVVTAVMLVNVRLGAAKRELGRSEELFRAIVENALDVMTIVDDTGTILLESPSVERVLGYLPEERLGENAFDSIHPDDVPEARTKLAKVLAEPDAVEQVVLRVRAKDASWREMEALGRNLTQTSALGGVLITSRDISHRQQAEELERRMGRILDDSMNEIFLVDPQTMRLIEANREACENLGYSLDELRQMRPFDFVVEPSPRELEAFLAPLFRGHVERVVRFGKHRRRDGSTYDVEVRVSMTRSDDPPLMIAVTDDITDRLATEAQLRQAQKLEGVGRLAGGVAHDFNNLLQVILGHGELLAERSDLTPGVTIGLRQILDAAGKAADLTRQLLAFSRKQILAPRLLDLNEVVDGTQKMIRRLIGEHIALEARLEPELGAVLVDRGQIEQAILNLVVNACDAMPDGGELMIETRNVVFGRAPDQDEPSVTAGPWVMLAVTDTGEGMTPDVSKQVFEPFFTTKELGKGTGLGLATVLGIVEQSGGRIQVMSKLGLGTRFEIYFPRVDGEIEQSEAEALEQAPRGTETILLVEDSDAVLDTVRSLLEESGYRVHCARRPDDALLLVERLDDQPDLLLTDVVMPVMSGRDLAGRLRELFPSLRVLLMSGHTGDSVVAAPGASPTAFIQKPFSGEALARKIREILDHSG